jgi:hypothetical protein
VERRSVSRGASQVDPTLLRVLEREVPGSQRDEQTRIAADNETDDVIGLCGPSFAIVSPSAVATRTTLPPAATCN